MVGYPRNVVVFLLASGSVGPEMLKLLKLNSFEYFIENIEDKSLKSVAVHL